MQLASGGESSGAAYDAPVAAVRRAVPVAAAPLLLRPWRSRTDADAVLAAAADELVGLWNPLTAVGPDTDALQAARDWCEQRADWSDGSHASWAVVDTADPGRVLGGISLHGLCDGDGIGRIGYWVLAEARRRGVASTALAAATRFAFAAIGLHRVELFHAVENAASCRTALRAGYALEGVHRDSHRYGDGRRHDEHTHARLATDP